MDTTITEKNGTLTVVDDNGNITRLYPNTNPDTTLSISGRTADAASVGEKISEIENKMENEIGNNVKTELAKINSDLDNTLYIVSFDASSGTLVTRSADYTG